MVLLLRTTQCSTNCQQHQQRPSTSGRVMATMGTPNRRQMLFWGVGLPMSTMISGHVHAQETLLPLPGAPVVETPLPKGMPCDDGGVSIRKLEANHYATTMRRRVCGREQKVDRHLDRCHQRRCAGRGRKRGACVCVCVGVRTQSSTTYALHHHTVEASGRPCQGSCQAMDYQVEQRTRCHWQ